MKYLTLSAIAILCAATFSACNDDDKKGNGPDLSGAFQTIVTFEGAGDNGSSYTVTRPGTTDLSTFTSTISLTAVSNNTVKPGQRVLIYYRNASGKQYESGPIQFIAYSKIKEGKAPLKPQSDISPLRIDPTEKDLIEVSGQYLNVFIKACGDDASLFDLYFDEETVDSPLPRAYIVFRSNNTSAAQHTFIGSFDISEVWDKPTCESITVYYGQGKNTSLKETFAKPDQSIRPME